jgi:hypothetical protein
MVFEGSVGLKVEELLVQLAQYFHGDIDLFGVEIA